MASKEAEQADPRAALLEAGTRLEALASLDSNGALSWPVTFGITPDEPSSPTEIPIGSPIEIPIGSPTEIPVASTPTLLPDDEDRLDRI